MKPSKKHQNPSRGSRDTLRESIRQAFANAPMPKRQDVLRPGSYEGGEAGDVLAAFADRPWTEIDGDTLEREHSALSFFSPVAFRYYLPAFMLQCLAGPRRGRNLDGSVVFHLDPPKKEGPDRIHFLDIVSKLTPEQKDVVREFLEHLRARDGDVLGEIRHALNSYWGARS